MTDDWTAVAHADSDEALQSAIASAGNTQVLAATLAALAERLEDLAAPAAQLHILELATRAGTDDRVRARRDTLAGLARLHLDPSDQHLAEVLTAVSALAAAGDAAHAVDAYIGVASRLTDHGRTGDAVAVAGRALDLLDIHPDLLTGERAVPAFSLRPIGIRTAMNAVDLAERLSLAATSPACAVTLARLAEILRRARLDDVRPLAAIALGCLLVRLGDAESGIEILHDWVGRSATVDDAARALDRARLWYAIGLHQTGRFDQALDGLRAHPWWDSQDDGRRLEVTAATARLLIDEDRLTEALDVLSSGDLSDDPLLVAMRAAVDARLHRRVDVPRHSAEGGPWARLARLEQAILTDPHSVIVPEGLADEFAAGGVRHRWETLLGSLASGRGETELALRHYRTALDLVLTPAAVQGWQEPYQDRAVESWQAELQTASGKDMRRGRGVGADLYLRIALGQRAVSEDPAEALASAIDAATRRNQYAALFSALLAEARRKEAAGLSSMEWRPDLERAADILEGLRSQLRDEELQLSALTDQDDVYAGLLRTALDAGDVDGAVRILERAKARTLLDRVSTTDRSQEDLGLADRDEARALRADIVRALGRRLTDPWGPDTVGPLKRRLANVYRRRRRAAVSVQAAATPQRAYELAAAGTLVLHYFCAPDRITLVPLGPPGAHPVPALDLTPDDVHTLLQMLEVERQVRGAAHSLAELYRGLIEPVEHLLAGADRLLVIPHGVVHSVPFAALRDSQGRHLVERLPVMNAPSVAVAVRAGAELAKPPNQDRSAAFGVELASYLPLASLPCVPAELDTLQELIPGVERFDRSHARRQALLEMSGDLDVLHFACHGEFDPDDPLLSRLYLADGPVYGYELLSVRFRPRLVVFSACETALHQRLPGDEALGLIRPFLAAGAGAVLATLWEVPDASTTALMEAFYRAYAVRAHDPAACLRDAQLQLLGSARFGHPHYWAPYVAVGGYPYG